MSETPNANAAGHSDAAAPPSKTVDTYIHRVCIQCNGVFRVPADKFDAKQCPNCHKG
ncbi:MAG TPA: hypothetical protein VEI54_06350 [Candidatus Limnocylindrales bacterium]|nr:hypothetical protein [Candidatus Limnocylindrales bacterium]